MSEEKLIKETKESLFTSKELLLRNLPLIPHAKRKFVTDGHFTKLGKSKGDVKDSELYADNIFPPLQILLQGEESTYRLVNPEYPQFTQGFDLILFQSKAYGEFGLKLQAEQKIDKEKEDLFYTFIRSNKPKVLHQYQPKPTLSSFIKEGNKYLIQVFNDLESLHVASHVHVPKTLEIHVFRTSVSCENPIYKRKRQTGFIAVKDKVVKEYMD